MLRATEMGGVILSKAKNLSGDVGKMARACPEQSEGMRRHILETVNLKGWRSHWRSDWRLSA
jgi:hypothetical protein